jgi:hypothetical protein
MHAGALDCLETFNYYPEGKLRGWRFWGGDIYKKVKIQHIQSNHFHLIVFKDGQRLSFVQYRSTFILYQFF